MQEELLGALGLNSLVGNVMEPWPPRHSRVRWGPAVAAPWRCVRRAGGEDVQRSVPRVVCVAGAAGHKRVDVLCTSATADPSSAVVKAGKTRLIGWDGVLEDLSVARYIYAGHTDGLGLDCTYYMQVLNVIYLRLMVCVIGDRQHCHVSHLPCAACHLTL